MGPETTMFSQTNSDSTESTLLAVPKLCDDGSNWSDYHPRIQNAMGAKGLWRHVLGTATAPVPYVVTEGIPMLSNGKTPATEDQIEAKESKIIEFEKREYLARHILLSTTSTRLGAKIKDLSTAEAMWKVVTDDATSKSTLYLLNAEDQLTSMKLADDEDPKTHLSELKQHFQLMLQRQDNLIKIGSTMSETRFNIIIMSSLPESYRPTLQTITASERMSKLSGDKSSVMKSDDLISFIIEEAQHRVINDERTKTAESALAARLKKAGKSEKDEDDHDVTCDNCKKPGHTKEQCYLKGGGSEGQGPRQKRKAKKSETATVATNDDERDLFAFTCSSDYAAVAERFEMLKSRLGTCMDSGASMDYCPDRARFTNYKSIQRKIMTADGRTLMAIGSGDLHIELPNGSGKTKVVFKNAIHAPEMAFTLISISLLDQAGYTVTFNKRVCTITDPNGKTIATIPHVDGMYKIATTVSPDINDATRQTKLYVPEKKRNLVSSYRKDKAYVETQSGNRRKTSCSDRGGEFITGKPDSQARNGRFVGYNSEPKGYWKTHWPIKGSRTIARISGEAQFEGESLKVIQASPKNTDSVEEPEAGPKEQQTQQVLTSENDSGTHQSPEPATKIPIYEANPEPKPETPDNKSSNQGYGRERWTRRAKQSFGNLKESLTAAIGTLHEDEIHGNDDDIYYSPKHPPKSTVFVANIPRKATEEDLMEVFTEFGEATNVRLHMKSKGRPRGIAHIEFANREIAVAAVDSAFREPIRLAGRKLHVDFATGVWDRKSIGAQPNAKQGDLQYHFIRKAVEERSKSSTYQSSRTIADIFSQSLGRNGVQSSNQSRGKNSTPSEQSRGVSEEKEG